MFIMTEENLKKIQGKSNKEWGVMAEIIAREWLLTHGYVIRETNWRAGKTIEIDIIAELPGTIVFVEVKARRGNVQTPLDAIDEKKMRKMAKGADIYLTSLKLNYRYRMDVITVTGTPENYRIDHIPDAFLPPLGRK